MEELCPQDRAILNSLFNPLLPIGEAVSDKADENECMVEDDSTNVGGPKARELNSTGVAAAEAGQNDEALKALSDAIAEAPDWAAPYNNRAQLYRLLRQEDDAIADLDKAVEITGGLGPVGTQAILQRGLLHRLRGEDDEARQVFRRAADQGSDFAKQQLVSLNPMAALCNKMLVRMMADARGES